MIERERAYPSTAESVQVGATNTTVRDLDVDISLFPGLGLKLLPDHLSLAGFGAETHPSFELVIGGRHCITFDETQQ